MVGALEVIATEMSWSRAYTRAVLSVWKGREAYCRAVLAYPTRIALDGSMTDRPSTK